MKKIVINPTDYEIIDFVDVNTGCPIFAFKGVNLIGMIIVRQRKDFSSYWALMTSASKEGLADDKLANLIEKGEKMGFTFYVDQ